MVSGCWALRNKKKCKICYTLSSNKKQNCNLYQLDICLAKYQQLCNQTTDDSL